MAIVHRIWIGGEMPVEYAEYGMRWALMNTGWDLIDWTEDMIAAEAWLNQDVIDDLYRRDDGRGTVELAVQVADVVGYELLWRFGGVYLNVDIEPIRSLAEMDEMYGTEGKTWLAREDDRFVVNAAMGAPEGDVFMRSVIEKLGPRYWANPTEEMNQTTGPRLLTDAWRSWTDDNGQVIALPVVAFNPFHWSSIPQGGDATGRPVDSGTIGLHHWGHRKDRRTNRIEHGNSRTEM